jgi:hypothetical protein
LSTARLVIFSGASIFGKKKETPMKFLTVLIFVFVSMPANAESVFRIEVGEDYKSYSQSDLQRRVWELERAVWQLQRRVFDLESKKPDSPLDSWVCKVTAMGNTYLGTGGSKAVAKANALESCKAARGGEAFFCSEPDCER